MGTTPPRVLEQFLTEREFWRELGVSRNVSLDDMPHLLVADYALIISMIRRDEHARASRNR